MANWMPSCITPTIVVPCLWKDTVNLFRYCLEYANKSIPESRNHISDAELVCFKHFSRIDGGDAILVAELRACFSGTATADTRSGRNKRQRLSKMLHGLQANEKRDMIYTSFFCTSFTQARTKNWYDNQSYYYTLRVKQRSEL